MQLFREPDFRKQYVVIDALYRSGRVKVPEALFYEDDPSVIGVPFFVMSQLHGSVPISFPGYNVEGFLFDATPAERRGAWESAMEELCRIALVPVHDFTFLDQHELGARAVDQQLEYWRRSIDWSTDDQTPEPVWAMFEWLAANVPSDAKNGFAWGDARIGNMMFGDDLRLVGVMDWEQANLSGTRMDLGWWLYFDDFHSTSRDLVRLDGLGTRAETIAFWEDRVGETVGDLTWYEVFTGFQVGLLSFRTMLILGSPTALDWEANLGFRIARGPARLVTALASDEGALLRPVEEGVEQAPRGSGGGDASRGDVFLERGCCGHGVADRRGAGLGGCRRVRRASTRRSGPGGERLCSAPAVAAANSSSAFHTSSMPRCSRAEQVTTRGVQLVVCGRTRWSAAA